MITLALSKGRIFDETLPLLAAAGMRPLDDPDASRKLILRTSRSDLRLLVVRASDVPTYVQYGAAELGIAGKDVLLEHGGAGLYQPLDLGIAACRMVVAVPEGFDYAGVHVDLIKLYGSMELAPLVGLADAIVDLVSTGDTLRANRLRAVEEILPISARLIVNQAALKMKRDAIQPLLDQLAKAAVVHA